MAVVKDRPKSIVTIGGGHGQTNMLRALTMLECEISAIVAVSDDGGCSGHLRRKYNMPPPGDIRRCLTALAQQRGIAELFESRLSWESMGQRSFGNMILSDVFDNVENLQVVSDIMADCLDCRGRVLPASLTPCTISARDQSGKVVVGETRIAQSGIKPHRIGALNNQQANPHAVQALAAADLIIVGPGSFYTSVLPPFTIPGIAEAFALSPARRVLMINLAEEGKQTEGMRIFDYFESFTAHLDLAVGRSIDTVLVDALSMDRSVVWLPEAVKTMAAHLRRASDPASHDPLLTARALGRWFDLPFIGELGLPAPQPQVAQPRFDRPHGPLMEHPFSLS
ncbi:MAG: YvcK family protein [Candidatus Alcyoniella australis]|nr:YvcK family protein [Candidatus Alcyoniella australis]